MLAVEFQHLRPLLTVGPSTLTSWPATTLQQTLLIIQFMFPAQLLQVAQVELTVSSQDCAKSLKILTRMVFKFFNVF